MTLPVSGGSGGVPDLGGNAGWQNDLASLAINLDRVIQNEEADGSYLIGSTTFKAASTLKSFLNRTGRDFFTSNAADLTPEGYQHVQNVNTILNQNLSRSGAGSSTTPLENSVDYLLAVWGNEAHVDPAPVTVGRSDNASTGNASSGSPLNFPVREVSQPTASIETSVYREPTNTDGGAAGVSIGENSAPANSGGDNSLRAQLISSISQSLSNADSGTVASRLTNISQALDGLAELAGLAAPGRSNGGPTDSAVIAPTVLPLPSDETDYGAPPSFDAQVPSITPVDDGGAVSVRAENFDGELDVSQAPDGSITVNASGDSDGEFTITIGGDGAESGSSEPALPPTTILPYPPESIEADAGSVPEFDPSANLEPYPITFPSFDPETGRDPFGNQVGFPDPETQQPADYEVSDSDVNFDDLEFTGQADGGDANAEPAVETEPTADSDVNLNDLEWTAGQADGGDANAEPVVEAVEAENVSFEQQPEADVATIEDMSAYIASVIALEDLLTQLQAEGSIGGGDGVEAGSDVDGLLDGIQQNLESVLAAVSSGEDDGISAGELEGILDSASDFTVSAASVLPENDQADAVLDALVAALGPVNEILTGNTFA